MVQLFSVPAFFILFRETLEAAIILSVMIALLDNIVEDQVLRKRMKKHVWLGVVTGVLLSLAAAAIFISLYYTVAKKAWESSEPLWEGILALVAVVLITIMAFSMIRVDTWRAKWEKKLAKVTVETLNKQGEVQSTRSKYALFLLPLSIVLREGCEAVIFLGGVGLEGSGTAVPIPAVVGAMCGILAGYLLYRGCSAVGFKWFLILSSALLLVISAGLFAGAVHELEEYTDNEHFLWQLHCCHEEKDGIWKILNAIVGWRDEATVGTLVSYICYWIFVAICLVLLRLKWKRDAEREAAELKLQQNANGDGIPV
jgi:high-affinity iron transporter